MSNKVFIKKGEHIIINNKALHFMRFLDSSCHIFAKDYVEAMERIKREFPEKFMLDCAASVAGHDLEFELEDINTEEIQWHGFAEIKFID
jgi:hypothetical protein